MQLVKHDSQHPERSRQLLALSFNFFRTDESQIFFSNHLSGSTIENRFRKNEPRLTFWPLNEETFHQVKINYLDTPVTHILDTEKYCHQDCLVLFILLSKHFSIVPVLNCEIKNSTIVLILCRLIFLQILCNNFSSNLRVIWISFDYLNNFTSVLRIIKTFNKL